MKHWISLFLAFVLMFGAVACGKGKPEMTQLGTSDLYIALPEGYAASADSFSENQVAYYYKDDESIDFDVYQWPKSDTCTLESEAEAYAAEHDTSPFPLEINGVNGMMYATVESYEGEEYTLINYMFDDGENLVELCFWTINTEDEIAFVKSIVNTIEGKHWVTLP